MSLDCSFWIAPSVFSNIYLSKLFKNASFYIYLIKTTLKLDGSGVFLFEKYI